MTYCRALMFCTLAGCTATSRDHPSTEGDTTAPSVAVEPKSRPNSVTVASGQDSTSHIAENRLAINGVRVGMNDVNVRALLGSPTDSTLPAEEEMHQDSVFVWRYPGLRISFDGHAVYDVRCKGAVCLTADSVRVGATRAAVVARYGPGFRGYDESSDVLIYHPDTPIDCSMVFSFIHDRVSGIALECDYS